MEIYPLQGNVHQAIVDFIDGGRVFAVATILASSGSTPRKAATRALIEADGTLWGTIGGGLLESRARELARKAITSGQAAILDFKFGGKDAVETVPVCGGNLRLLIDPHAARHRGAWVAAATAQRERRRGVLATIVQNADNPVVMMSWHETPDEIGAGDMTLIERVVPEARLVIMGGGHVAQALATNAHLAGFELIIIEDRPEFARSGLFPERSIVRCGEPESLLNEIIPDPDTYVAIVSRGHLTDGRALAACLNKPFAYIGMMGSRRKVALLRAEFLRCGRATAEQFDRIHAPIGLDIGAESVPEIAVSIVAELIAVRRGGRP